MCYGLMVISVFLFFYNWGLDIYNPVYLIFILSDVS